MVARI
jgi:hypothetical protein